MKDMVLTVKAFKGLVKESSNEFKAKIGPGVEREDKKNNGKAYSDAEKRAKDYDGGLADEVGEVKSEYKKEDLNKTTLDYTPENATPEYKKRVHAQVDGYTSDLEKNNGLEKAGDFSDNEKIYKELKKTGQEQQKKDAQFKASGLQAREWPKEVFEKDSMYESKSGFDMRQMINRLKENENLANKQSVNENIKTVYYKKTKFITENHMISKIPDDFKVNGLKFNMKDCDGNIYLVEWKNNKANIINHMNKTELNENFDRMKQLMSYKTTDTKTTSTDRLNENENTFHSTLNKIRGLMN